MTIFYQIRVDRNNMNIYLDNAATTRVYPEVAELMTQVMCQDYGNPSSLHRMGMQAEKHIKQATEIIARELKVTTKELIFTSGGTESDNLALIGCALANQRRGKHIITSSIEHPAVLEPMKYLESQGFEVTYLSVDDFGVVSIDELKQALRNDTILVSIMMQNNEIGSIQPIQELAQVVHAYHSQILFHCDAVQAFGKMKIHPKKLGTDLLTISAHKIHGPKGVGLLYIRQGVKISPLFYGGKQQYNIRSGTENVPAIAGFGLATSMVYQGLEDKKERMLSLKQHLLEGLQQSDLSDVHVNPGDSEYIVSVGFKGVRAEVLLHALEEKGIYISSGSACASNKREISEVLKAIRCPQDFIECVVRFSFSEFTTMEEIDITIEAIQQTVPMLRRFVRK